MLKVEWESIKEKRQHQAPRDQFDSWLMLPARQEVVVGGEPDEGLDGVLPGGTVVMFNTEWGLEADLPSTPVPDATRPRIAAAFVAHLEEAGTSTERET